MKYLFCLLLIGISQKSAAQSDTISALITRLKKTAITAAEKKALRAFAFDIQNRGQRLDESGRDYKKALQLTESAIYLFKCLQDTLSEANNRKFKGYLLGRSLFQLKQADWAYLSLTFQGFTNFRTNLIQHCIIATQQSPIGNGKAILKGFFLTKTCFINLLTKRNELTIAQKVQFESQKITDSIKPQWQGLLDFYIVSENLYKVTHEIKATNNYHYLYSKLVAELNRRGIEAKSYFDKK